MCYEITQVDKKNIQIIEPLWEQLNDLHLQESPYFKSHYESFTFSERSKKFLKIRDENLLIEVIKKEDEICGYCISTIVDDIGEIDSLFILEKDRKNGLGEKLINRSIDWMKKNSNKIQVSVSYGHESVFGFYEKFGLFPRLTYLELKNT